MSETLLLLLLALLLDRVVGDPDWLWRRVPHPVVLFGWAIGLMDKLFNGKRLSADTKRFNGAVCIAVLLAASALSGFVVHRLLAPLGILGALVEIIIIAIFLAQKSLYDHVRAVSSGLKRDGLAGGRQAVSMIVGRDPATLDEPAICRAGIESLAENFSDGVVAPALWYALLGLPGLFAYKMLNTADSMIGHKNAKYLDFGRASARLDDFANWPAARFSIFLIAVGAWAVKGRAAARHAVGTALRDAGLHRSPNSGWPEAAMAGALGIGLAGPRIYGGTRVDEPMMNASGRTVATVADIDLSLRIFSGACAALAAAVLLAMLLVALL
ncbi:MULTISPECIES: adenosylcobinamide-phosphate synthase CbiB [unclassified Shinella]|jgi:adenosylcobinamide-phosphate synthase|uniref:adenosylcobinamide-phosphate synthase CbiB n=1 Tax=unclassified Shinella TaxID=2643062 RepID=UPI00234F36A7|nr:MULTISPECIES: adenosylcobinamide-phosphate synthase CbiB [unclassified Shinella]MCO5149673.1 adenosylcobinamide-phosphate synthase CbiB [Shinella sp.]MDC7262420.1 adenosylcobinamide-phosphate synthase CbiB [Shinella sp. HY16]MDC7269315.1 adenosylcobinamide-phosphate synthase CbiB [Shinella sp. YZ44]